MEDVKPVELEQIVTENLEVADGGFDEPVSEQVSESEPEEPAIEEEPAKEEAQAVENEEAQPAEEIQPEQEQPAAEEAQPEQEQPEQPAAQDFTAEQNYIEQIMAEANAEYAEKQEESALKEQPENGEAGEDKGGDN